MVCICNCTQRDGDARMWTAKKQNFNGRKRIMNNLLVWQQRHAMKIDFCYVTDGMVVMVVKVRPCR